MIVFASTHKISIDDCGFLQERKFEIRRYFNVFVNIDAVLNCEIFPFRYF